MNIILASKSPRRIELLKKIIDDFEVIPSTVEEVLDLNYGIEEGMKKLAYAKAHEVFKSNSESIVIGSDTLVFLKDKPLGKPKDRAHASQILKSLRGQKHSVYTSVAILSQLMEIVYVKRTDVTFKDFSDEDLYEFLDTNIWTDKSGAYAIQSLDERYVEAVVGDVETVIGFPTTSISQHLDLIINFSLEKDD